MTKGVLGTAALSLAMLFVATGVHGQQAKKSVEITEKNSTLKKDEIGILRPGGIAGATVEVVKYQGPASFSVKNIPILKDGRPVIGPSSTAIELVPTGTGTIEITVRITNPGNQGNSTDHHYKIDVK